jgi:uncharacterized membrane protein
MTLLIAGLVLFLGIHSIRIVADDTRSAAIASWGAKPWKVFYTLVSFAGLALIVWGYGLARGAPVVLWSPPLWTRTVASLLLLPAFALLAAGHISGTRIKAAVGHPMVLGAKTWAIAHLISNGTLADVVLFGGFLAWAVLDFRSARHRDRAAGVTYPPGTLARDGLAVGIGIAAWAAFAFLLHGPLIGVRPFG